MGQSLDVLSSLIVSFRMKGVLTVKKYRVQKAPAYVWTLLQGWVKGGLTASGCALPSALYTSR
jgi:hypothetical protein